MPTNEIGRIIFYLIWKIIFQLFVQRWKNVAFSVAANCVRDVRRKVRSLYFIYVCDFSSKRGKKDIQLTRSFLSESLYGPYARKNQISNDVMKFPIEKELKIDFVLKIFRKIRIIFHCTKVDIEGRVHS